MDATQTNPTQFDAAAEPHQPPPDRGSHATQGQQPAEADQHTCRILVEATNVCLMRLLGRLAGAFERARIPLMALKGAALNLTILEHPDQRPMSDLDLMIRREDVQAAFSILAAEGCTPGRRLVREDFFPRFHYEVDFIAGRLQTLRIDLHVRPFRPLRYARLVPPDAFWARACRVPAGQGRILIPCTEDMLIHLAAHSAVHGNARLRWLEDIKLWVQAHRDRLDWDLFLATVGRWRLALPVLSCLKAAESRLGNFLPPGLLDSLEKLPVSWRDRLALWQAPRDAAHPAMHVLTDFVCTPGWRFTTSYLWRVLFPGRAHMEEWYGRTHPGWLPWAHFLRLTQFPARRIPPIVRLFSKTEIRRCPVHGPGLFASRDIRSGEVVMRVPDRPSESSDNQQGASRLPGKLRFLHRDERANVVIRDGKLIAIRPILTGRPITLR